MTRTFGYVITMNRLPFAGEPINQNAAVSREQPRATGATTTARNLPSSGVEVRRGAKTESMQPSKIARDLFRCSSERPASWSDLDDWLKLSIVEMCDSERSVHALAKADLHLMPLIAAAPGLLVRQKAYKDAVNGTSGAALLAVLRQHLPAYWACKDDYFLFREDESIEVITEFCHLRAGRGPTPVVHLEQDLCSERLPGLPAEVHVDMDLTAHAFQRRQPPLLIPAQVHCLFVSAPDTIRYVRSPTGGNLVGRHEYHAEHAIERLFIHDLNLTGGRLDFSKILECHLLEMWNCHLGEGNFGIRWPRTVETLRLTNCVFSDQSASFALPDGLQNLDLYKTPIASNDPNWRFSSGLRFLDANCSPISAQLLPRVFPQSLKSFFCTTQDYAPQLNTTSFPSGILEIKISHVDSYINQPRRVKLSKRNWQRALKKIRPEAFVSIR